MAVYNSEKYLSEAIESILNQTFDDFEFIIINDYSTDNSLKIIKKYAKKDKRIKLINNEKNLGRAKARNLGLKIAKSKYLAILDSDDIALPERLKKQYNYLEKNENVFLLGTGSDNINEDGKNRTTFNILTSFEEVSKRLPKNNCIYHSSIMFRNTRKYFYREKFPYSQDYDLYLRLLSDGKKLINVSEKLIKYRINPDAIGQTKRGKQGLFAEKAKEFYQQRLRYGKDEYNQFNPIEILKIDVEKTINKLMLKGEIFASFELNNFKRTRKFCKKYFKNYGIFNKFFIYYLLSFTNKRFVNFLRKILFC